MSPQGKNKLNPFGEDFDDEKYKWTKKLCEEDSDGDGFTNGQELGDPNWYIYIYKNIYIDSLYKTLFSSLSKTG